MATPQESNLAKRAEHPLIVTIQKMEPEIRRALPRHLNSDRMMRMCLTALRSTPKLLQCESNSVLGAFMELSQLGLEPSTPLGHAWVLPYKDKAKVIIGYKGYIALAARAGIAINAEVVYDADQFTYPCLGDSRIVHVPSESERGERRYAYAGAVSHGFPFQFKVVNRSDIARAKATSASVRFGRETPWDSDEDAMWRKTAVRRLAPFLPLTPELARAIELDDEASGSRTTIEVGNVVAESASGNDRLRAAMNIPALPSHEPAEHETQTPLPPTGETQPPGDALFADKPKGLPSHAR